jgi:hypothetical protein
VQSLKCLVFERHDSSAAGYTLSAIDSAGSRDVDCRLPGSDSAFCEKFFSADEFTKVRREKKEDAALFEASEYLSSLSMPA